MFSPEQIHVCFSVSQIPEQGRMILFAGRDILLTDECLLPQKKKIGGFLTGFTDLLFCRIGKNDDIPFFGAEIPLDRLPETLADNLVRCPFRASLAQSLPAEQMALCRAKTILFWRNQHQFCGKCRTALKESDHDLALICPRCGAHYFPQLAPAVIVAVTRNENREILLAHNRNFERNVHSLIAGFVEAGETVEHAVQREVMEEASIRVKNIRYLYSQAWPFPNSLMLAFRAEFESGKAEPDGTELDRLGWFTPENLPPLPGQGSIAAAVIDRWITSQHGKNK